MLIFRKNFFNLSALVRNSKNTTGAAHFEQFLSWLRLGSSEQNKGGTPAYQSKKIEKIYWAHIKIDVVFVFFFLAKIRLGTLASKFLTLNRCVGIFTGGANVSGFWT